MIYVIVGSDYKSKREFVQRIRQEFLLDSFEVSIEVLVGKDITSSKIVQDLFRIMGLGGRKLVVVWDVDSLSKKIFRQMGDILTKYVLDSKNIVAILEGSGTEKSISSEFCRLFPDGVLSFGTIVKEIDFFALANDIIDGRFIDVGKCLAEGRFSYGEFQQLIGALRFVIEKKVRDNMKRESILRKLLSLDVKVKVGQIDWMTAVLDLMYVVADGRAYAS